MISVRPRAAATLSRSPRCLRGGRTRGLTFGIAVDRDPARGELDAVLDERLLDPGVGLAPDHELLARPAHELDPDHEAGIVDLGHALGLDRLQEHRTELGIVLNLLTDMLDHLAHQLEVGIERHAQLELDLHPIAAVVDDVAHLAEGDRVQWAAMVAQLHRAHRDLLDHPLAGIGLDVLALAEGILEQEEQAGDHVLDQGLGAEADRETDHAGAREQRPDVDAERGQRGHHRDGDDRDEQKAA